MRKPQAGHAPRWRCTGQRQSGPPPRVALLTPRQQQSSSPGWAPSPTCADQTRGKSRVLRALSKRHDNAMPRVWRSPWAPGCAEHAEEEGGVVRRQRTPSAPLVQQAHARTKATGEGGLPFCKHSCSTHHTHSSPGQPQPPLGSRAWRPPREEGGAARQRNPCPPLVQQALSWTTDQQAQTPQSAPRPRAAPPPAGQFSVHPLKEEGGAVRQQRPPAHPSFSGCPPNQTARVH